MSYTNAVVVPLPYAEAVERTRAALAEQGFGILTEIDVRATFEKKLGAEAAEGVGDYVILGACNPDLAHRALEVDRGIGTLLPCNVVVTADGDRTQVRIFDPMLMAQVTGREEIAPIAAEAERRLTDALAALPQTTD